MPKREDIKRTLVIGSGPIVIGQAAEFDYAGTQACRALKEEGIEVILINSNPATIMTDKAMADKIYIEPLTIDVIKRIIETEKPDSVLATLGGQIGLNMGMELARDGYLEKMGVRLLGANPETIEKAEDRQVFKDTMAEIGEPCIASKVVEEIDDAVAFANEIGYPVVVRPAYTMGGAGGGFADDDRELREIGTIGLRTSPIHQILIEKSIAGWKEIEYEAIRDAAGNCITVCSMENIDPVGIHTGDSIVVAPAQTLTDSEGAALRASALNIVTALGVEGGCNVQFAVRPDGGEYAVIEVNPRVSRSSALASKATGYPIAKVASKIAIGYHLDEILNAVTGTTYAINEPAVDYCVLKFPKWPFDKFVYAKRQLGTQMKATGEVMSIGNSFELGFMKAVRSVELGIDTPNLPKLLDKTDAEIERMLGSSDDERIFVVYQALKRGISPNKIFEITMIDHFFLSKLKNIADMEQLLTEEKLDKRLYLCAKKMGFLDKTIRRLSGQEPPIKRDAAYKMVDTCAAEFDAQTPYFYSTWDEENEAEIYLSERKNGKKKILVLGSGPIRIGQGIEFDYCSVHCVRSLKEHGCEAIIANNNPETVSTDFDTADRLYFDPLTPEDVRSVIAAEKPDGVVVQFGGQTAIKLAREVEKMGIKILGTSPDAIDEAEDRERFDALTESLGIPRPRGNTVFTREQAVAAANKLGYPVLLRPSYVLGGQNMIIAMNDEDVEEYMGIITANGIENPVLIDEYMMGREVEVDAICDGEDYLIPGVMEHVERAGVHSGDSISVYPAQTLSQRIIDTIVEYTGRFAKALGVVGLINIQYVVKDEQVYVIEVNPRSSRTVPYISKVTNVPMVDLATRCMLGERLRDLGFGTGLYPSADYVAVKVPVFSFEKLHDLDTQLGPEMKSTGEVLGISDHLNEALYKGFVAAGMKMSREGGVFITVKDADKPEAVALADKFAQLGFDIYATAGTAHLLNENMIAASSVKKIHEGSPNTLDLLESGKIRYVVSTSARGRLPEQDDVRIRRKAVESAVMCFTSLDTANAWLSCLDEERSMRDVRLIDITKI